MKTFADVKRRIQLGTRLLCIRNTYRRGELDGTVRTVVKVQGNAFAWTWDGSNKPGEKSWTYWTGAKDITIIDGDTFRLRLTGPPRTDQEHYVELKFITQGDQP